MSDGLIEKLIGGVLRAFTGLIVTGGGLQLLDGQWYGRTIFQAYLSRLNLQQIATPPSTEFYSTFAGESIPMGLRETSAWLVGASLVIGFAALAHVLGKPAVNKMLTTITRPDLSAHTRSRPKFNNLLGIGRVAYLTYQPVITLSLFLLLTGFFFAWPFERGLAFGFLVAAIPSALYLLLYPADFTGGTFLERFVYVTVLALLVLMLVGWPHLYATKLFDPDLPSVFYVDDSAGHCGTERLLKGPAFVLSEKGDEQIVLRLCFDRRSSKQYVDYFAVNNSTLERVGTATLRQAIESFVRPPN